MNKGYFVTGTDTGVGKTLVSTALITALRNQGLRVSGMKPVASGCEKKDGCLRNEDADRLLEASNVEANYEIICPYRFPEPVAPHIAAQKEGVVIKAEHIVNCFQHLRLSSDAVVVEGVGGWRVPINDNEMMSDIAVTMELPVVLVVGGRLGCINHALLTLESIQASGLPLTGWVFNQVDIHMQRRVAVLAELKCLLPAPLLADIPWQLKPDGHLLVNTLCENL